MLQPIRRSVPWLLLLGLLITVASQRLTSSNTRFSLPWGSSLSRSQVRMLTFGHENLYDEYLALWWIDTVTDPKTKSVDFSIFQRALEVLLEKQPRIERLYVSSCLLLAFEYQRPEACAALSRIGISLFPQSWQIPFIQGYIYAHRLQQPSLAIFYYQLAAQNPGAPSFLLTLAQKPK